MTTPDGAAPAPAADPHHVRSQFAQYPTGVVALTATVDGVQEVFVASSFQVGVSIKPPLVMLAIQEGSQTWQRLRTSAEIGVSVLSKDQDLLCRQLSARVVGDRLADVPTTSRGATFYIDGAAAYYSCRLYAEHPAGDHVIVVLEVDDFAPLRDMDPLVFHKSRFGTVAESR